MILEVSQYGQGRDGQTHITLSDHTNMSNNLDRSRPQHMILIIRQSLTRRNNDRIPRMCSQWIEILHITTNDRVLPHQPEYHQHAKSSPTSAASRTTSYSTSFHPFKLFSINTCGLRLKLFAARFRSSSSSYAKPEPRPPREKADRRMMG